MEARPGLGSGEEPTAVCERVDTFVALVAATIPPPWGEGLTTTKADACDPLPTDGKEGGGETGEGSWTFAGTPAAPGVVVCVPSPICDAMCDVGGPLADTVGDAPADADGT